MGPMHLTRYYIRAKMLTNNLLGHSYNHIPNNYLIDDHVFYNLLNCINYIL